MRGNLFQYHVQDRMYDKAEVLSLINNEQYKHHLLSGGTHFYSLGSSAEVVGAVFGYAAVGAAIVTSLVVGAALLSGLAKNDNFVIDSNQHKQNANNKITVRVIR